MVNVNEPKMVKIIHEKPDKKMTLSMIHLPKGSFLMGSNEHHNESPLHQVPIEHEFELGKYVVTIKEYMYFVEDTQSHYPEWLDIKSEYHIKRGKSNHYKKMNLTEDMPIVGISWYDAMAYCQWLSEKTENNYRLPTEEEWEYACRAETQSRWSFGNEEASIEEYAWYDKNANGTIHPVGKKKPNPWGFYDMHGNVWEWCQNDWRDNYVEKSQHIKKNTELKVVRGGSWNFFSLRTRSAYRFYVNFKEKSSSIGFRLLRVLS